MGDMNWEPKVWSHRSLTPRVGLESSKEIHRTDSRRDDVDMKWLGSDTK
jgi:hypothetical protein